MKRGTFRRKTYQEVMAQKIARSVVKKTKPKTVKEIQKDILKPALKRLWELCKTIIRKRDGRFCFVCGAVIKKKRNKHTGHFIPSASCGGYLRYDIRNLALSCYHCNINCGGNGALFNQRLREVYGDDFVNKLFIDKRKIIKLDFWYVSDLIKQYEKIVDCTPLQLFKFTRDFRKDVV